MNFLEEVWTQREEETYKTIFGNVSSDIYPLTSETFKQYNCEKVDPKWLTHGVFKSEPTKNRKT